MEWHEIIVSILSGLAVTIPLVIKLIEYVKKAIREKNWGDLLNLVTDLMTEAEGKFDNGEDRKEWVLMCVKASADTIDYDIDLDEVAELIDSLCAMSKVVNVKTKETAEEVVE